MLAARLGIVMNKLNSTHQSTILTRRLLVDGVVVGIEVIDLVTRIKKTCLILRWILRKYMMDPIKVFLDYILLRFEFNDKRRYWMRICVFFLLEILRRWLMNAKLNRLASKKV